VLQIRSLDVQSDQISDHELNQEKIQRSGGIVPRIPNLSTS